MQRAAVRQQQAWAPGTLANYNSAIRKYIKFCYDMMVCPTDPTNAEVCAYLEFLADTTPSPRTIGNHLAHIRTYCRRAGVDISQLEHIRVSWAMTAMKRNKDYIPRVKLAFPIEDLQRMVITLPQDPRGNLLRVAVLIMFYAALRQSEVLAPTMSSFDKKKHLTRGDVQFHDQAVSIHIKHAKNMQSVYQNKTVRLSAAENPLLCVAAALRSMYEVTPTIHQYEPCLMFPTSRRPVPIDFVRRNWKAHLEAHGISIAALSLHSIRKSAATAAHDQGCGEIDIQQYGGWRSNSHRQYIHTSQSRVNHAITRALNNPN